LLNISAVLLYKKKRKNCNHNFRNNEHMDNRKGPLLSELSTTMQLYALFKNATGKGKELNFHELLAVRLKCFAAGEKA